MTFHIFTNPYAYFTLIGASAFGLAYNRIYEHYRKEGKTKPYTAIAVVVGCALLLLTSGFFIGLEAMLFLFALFAAAGMPMTWGDFNRAYELQQKELKEEIKRLKDRRGPRDWPTKAKNARDDTAEDLNALTIELSKTLHETDPHKLQIALAHTLVVVQTSLRRRKYYPSTTIRSPAMLPKFSPLPPDVTLEKVDTIPPIKSTGRRGQPSKYAWLFERLLAMKPRDIYKLTVPNKKAKDLHQHSLQKWIREQREDKNQRKTWKVKTTSADGSDPAKPYHVYIDCVVFDPVTHHG